MRSRTELVTTTFVESDEEEDYSPDDDSDSEEDWRPTKKRPPKQPRIALAVAGGGGSGAAAGASGSGGSEAASRKRKAAGTATKAKRRHSKLDSDDDDSDIDDDDDDLETDPSDEDFEYPLASTSKRPQNLPPKKQFVKLHQVDLLMKKADLLDKDWAKNTRLCLWRKDVQASLLQKFLRVKSEPGEEQLLFTSSSVYSSWDEQNIGDYLEVKANCLDPNNRRFKLHDMEGIMKISEQLLAEQDKDDPDEEEEEAEQPEPESEPVPDMDEEDVEEEEEEEALEEDEEEAEDEGQEHTDETDP